MSLDVLKAFSKMTLRPADQWMRDNPQAMAEIEANILAGPSMALPDNENPCVVFGVFRAHGVGTVWMVVGQDFQHKWRMVWRLQRQLCRTAFEALGLRRLQLLVDDSNHSHQRYAEALGFCRETTEPHIGLGARGENLVFYTWKGSKT